MARLENSKPGRIKFESRGKSLLLHSQQLKEEQPSKSMPSGVQCANVQHWTTTNNNHLDSQIKIDISRCTGSKSVRGGRWLQAVLNTHTHTHIIFAVLGVVFAEHKAHCAHSQCNICNVTHATVQITSESFDIFRHLPKSLRRETLCHLPYRLATYATICHGNPQQSKVAASLGVSKPPLFLMSRNVDRAWVFEARRWFR